MLANAHNYLFSPHSRASKSKFSAFFFFIEEFKLLWSVFNEPPCCNGFRRKFSNFDAKGRTAGAFKDRWHSRKEWRRDLPCDCKRTRTKRGEYLLNCILCCNRTGGGQLGWCRQAGEGEGGGGYNTAKAERMQPGLPCCQRIPGGQSFPGALTECCRAWLCVSVSAVHANTERCTRVCILHCNLICSLVYWLMMQCYRRWHHGDGAQLRCSSADLQIMRNQLNSKPIQAVAPVFSTQR